MTSNHFCPITLVHQHLLRDKSKMDEADETSRVRQRNIAVERVFQRATLDPEVLAREKLTDKEIENFIRPKVRGPPEPRFSVSNIIWMIVGMATFYYTDFAVACLYDPRVHRIWFNVGAGLISVNVSIAVFLIFYLTGVKKVPSSEWENRYPFAIPIATAAFIFGGVCVTIGLWPVWTWFTPLILFTLTMSFIVLISILPDWI